MIESFINWLGVDITGLLVQLFFIYNIALMIKDNQKPPLQTCILTGLALLIISDSGSYVSDATAILSAVVGVMWLYVGFQRYRQKSQV